MEKDKLVQFRDTERQRERYKCAARIEGVSLSEWLRRLALLRLAELGDRVAEQSEATPAR